MAVVAHLVERTASAGDNDIRNGISSVIVAIDDAVDTTDALIQARAVTVLTAAGLDIPEGYFNTNRSVAGTFDAAGDVFLCAGPKMYESVAA